MQEYWNNLKNNILFILLISTLAAFIAFVLVGRQGVVHEVHFSYLVALEQRDDVSEYRFDGFYALQATDMFSSTLAHLITTPEVIAAAYTEADIELITKDPRQLRKIIRAEKTAPQLVEISIKHANEDIAVSLAHALQTVMVDRIDNYHDQGIPALSFNAVPGEIWTGQTKLSVPVVVIGVFIFTLLLSINVLLLMASLRKIND